jgi:hypothetical protein
VDRLLLPDMARILSSVETTLLRSSEVVSSNDSVNETLLESDSGTKVSFVSLSSSSESSGRGRTAPGAAINSASQ